MKLEFASKLLALSLGAMALAMTGCSGSQEDEEKLDVEADDADAQGSANAEAEASTETEEEPADAVAQDTPAEDPTPDASATTGGYAATGGGTEAGRVVRYVNASQAPLYGSANETGGSVGQLLKGDRVMVVIEGAYGRISDGMYIKVDHLSAKPVARDRKDAVWHSPAH